MVLRNRLFAEWCVLLVACCALALWAGGARLTQRFDLSLLDLASSQVAGEPSDDLVVVAIDDRSLAAVGPWPWSRRVHAGLVDRLSQAGARAIVLDILFLEPTDAADDGALADSMARAGNVVLPHTFTPSMRSATGLEAARPIPALAAAAMAEGHVGLDFEGDGIFRRPQLSVSTEAGAFPQLMAATREAVGLSPGRSAGGTAPRMAFHPPGSYATVSASSVLAGEVPARLFAGKVVIVGAAAQGLRDRYAVPAYAGFMMSGAEIQANLFDALAHDLFIRDLSPAAAAAISVAVVLAVFVAFWLLGPRAVLLSAVALAAACLAGSWLGVVAWKTWFPPGPALLAIVVAYPLWGWRRLAAVSDHLQHQARRISQSAGHLAAEGASGFDTVARQIALSNALVGELDERFAFVRTVIEAAPDGIVVLDRTGAAVMMNGYARAMFGAGTPLPRLADGEELTLSDGRVCVVARAAFDHADGGGEIVALHDITDIRRAEAERREMLEFLSHDMRSPQVAILGLTGPGEPTDDGDRLGRIRGLAQRTLALAESFVQLARMAETPLQRDELDLAGLLLEAADRHHVSARRKSVAIETDGTDEPVFIRGDGALLARVFDNLIDNAIKFSPEGGRVHLALDQPEGGHVGLRITDQGPGLPAERRGDPFARFGGGAGGVGLGLAFVKMAVEKHEGTVTAGAGPGGGARFTISLPA